MLKKLDMWSQFLLNCHANVFMQNLFMLLKRESTDFIFLQFIYKHPLSFRCH